MKSFFLSYTSQDYRAAQVTDFRSGREYNLLDAFFNQLCNNVAGKLPIGFQDIAYRDQADLRLGNIWAESLTDALQQSRTLIALLSPNYLTNENCERELKFMQDRFRLLQEQNPDVRDHCIIPIFWENNRVCDPHWKTETRDLIQTIQANTNAKLPRGYEGRGLKEWLPLANRGEQEAAFSAIAEAIVANYNDELPLHQNPRPFNQLPTFSGEVRQHSGPKTVHVVYVVGTKRGMRKVGAGDTDRYASRRQGWLPFTDAPDITIAEATRKGIENAGLMYLDWNWPRGLVQNLLAARKANSIVLFVLDRYALRLSTFAAEMKRYARYARQKETLSNIGLVTAGGHDVPDAEMEAVFESEFSALYPHHEWTVVTEKVNYMAKVQSTVSALRRHLMRQGIHPHPLPGSSPPFFTEPKRGDT